MNQTFTAEALRQQIASMLALLPETDSSSVVVALAPGLFLQVQGQMARSVGIERATRFNAEHAAAVLADLGRCARSGVVVPLAGALVEELREVRAMLAAVESRGHERMKPVIHEEPAA